MSDSDDYDNSYSYGGEEWDGGGGGGGYQHLPSILAEELILPAAAMATGAAVGAVAGAAASKCKLMSDNTLTMGTSPGTFPVVYMQM